MLTGAPTRSRHGRRRRIAAGVAGVLALVAALAAIEAARGKVDSYARTALITPAQKRRAPGWTQPCGQIARWSGFASCLRVAGRVVWRQERDGDGDGDRHLFVVSRLHLHIVKLPKGLPAPLPPVGSRIEAVGWEMRGSHGRTELDTLQIRAGGLARG